MGYTLKEEQKHAVESVLQKKDTFVQLPTGYGKSLIFQLLPKIIKERVLIACPLLSLIESHKVAIENNGMTCGVLGKPIDQNKHYDFIIGTPERLLRQDTRDWIKQLNICCFVADEVHTIPKW